VELRRRALSRALVPAALIALALLAAPGAASAAGAFPTLQYQNTNGGAPAGYRLTPLQAIAIAERTPQVHGERTRHPHLVPGAYTNGPGRWQVSYFQGRKELAQVIVDDRSGAVVEAWTGYQVAWRMARGYPGAFGRRFNAIYVWLPLGVLFLLPFVDPRRPFRLLHLDLLVLVAFAVSHFFFEQGKIGVSVPLVYPVLAYLLARMLLAGFRPRRPAGRLVPWVPPWALALAILFLIGFRGGLNALDSNVIDVGYSGVIGADRIEHGQALYEGGFPADDKHGDTYGPVNYLLYVPAELVKPWSGRWDDLPAAHATAVAFDLLTLLGLFLLGRSLRAGPDGRLLGLALAFAWAAYPYTLFTMSSNSNDSLVAMFVVWALLAVASPPARGALVALGGAAKFAPLAVAPLFVRGRGALRTPGTLIAAAVAVAVFVVAFVPFLPDGGVHELWHRTLGYQVNRPSPFSVWGQVSSLDWLHTAVEVGAAALAVLVAFLPRRRDDVQIAALAAAALIAFQLAASHWFYLYIVWFAPLAFVALFGRYGEPDEPPRREERAGAARERAPALA
jgi:hypothetical protein